MGKLKRILVTTDLSTHSQFALLRAVELAKRVKAQLTILHVAETSTLEKIMGNTIPIVRKVLITPEEYAESFLEKQVEKLSKQNLKINYMILSGDNPARKILHYAENNQFDLLVLGAHGRYSIRDCMVGTTAEYVARKSHLPILIVKKPVKNAYQKILVPTDFSAASGNALKFARTLFPKADLNVLHVGDHDYDDLLDSENTIPKNKMKKVRDGLSMLLKDKTLKFMKKCGIRSAKSTCYIKFGYPGVVIVDEAKRMKLDLVIMGAEGHSQRHYLFIGRVASRVLMDLDRDVLLVPGNK